ncbi:MAG: hypothetical protein KJP00_13140 [Bacteroidia bacterium]|nr:hypothetical protein [Bacteroidia bacterium]
MNRIIAFLIITTLIICSCTRTTQTISTQPEISKEEGIYEHMHFVREGGGQIDFNIYPTANADQLEVIVSKHSFRDTTIQFLISKNAENIAAFSAFHNAIHNKVQITGNHDEPQLATGTWSYVYFVRDATEFEVSNIELRDALFKFEELVQNNISQ